MTAESGSRTLVVGWFSFPDMGATAGDVIAKDVVLGWLQASGRAVDVAMVQPALPGEVGTEAVEPTDYDELVFVCGPIGDGPPINEYLDRFEHARRYALNVTLLQSRDEWNPFEHVVERDSDERVNPDLTFLADDRETPVVGLLLVGPQGEYPASRHADAEVAIRGALGRAGAAVVEIDTRLDSNRGGLVTADQIESLIAHMDAVVTTRLHGAVLALRRGVPPVAIDAVPGGGKVSRQMARLGWPLSLGVEQTDERSVAEALARALEPASRMAAHATAARARADLLAVKHEFMAAVEDRA